MSEVTQILSAIEGGDPRAAEQLLPLVYKELRRLAARKLAQEMPGQTLEPTALVHEAYLRLVKGSAGEPAEQPGWNSRGHFFAAAAEAMRRILIDHARSKRSVKRGGGRRRLTLDEGRLAANEPADSLVALDQALDRLAAKDAQAAQLVKLRFFAGLTSEQAAQSLGISTRTGERVWAYARAFLFKEVNQDRDGD